MTRMTVFAVFSTTQRLDPWSSSPSMEFGMRPATLIGALAPVTGFTVNSLSSTVLSTIRLLPSAVGRRRDAVQIEAGCRESRYRTAEGDSHRATQATERSDRDLVYIRVVAVREVGPMGSKHHVIDQRFPIGAKPVLSYKCS